MNSSPTVNAVLKVDANTSVSMSYTGRFAAFNTSSAMQSNDVNGVSDIYVKDFSTGAMARVSVGANGTEANGASYQPSLSADGRFLVFTSLASNLVSGDDNGVSDVFVKDLQTGVINMVSAAAEEGNGASRSGKIAADGKYVTFVSAATNLDPTANNTGSQVYRKSLEDGKVELVSANSASVSGNGVSQAPDISADGQTLSFSSYSSNLSELPTPAGVPHPYLKNMLSDALFEGWAVSSRIPVVLPVQSPMISYNAMQVTVTVSGTVYFLDFNAKAASNISNGLHGEYVSYATNRAISADGGRVLYSAAGDDTIGADDTPFIQLYLRDTANGTLERLSTSADGYAANANIGHAALSGDGKVAMFVSSASNLGGPNAGAPQLFRSVITTLTENDQNKYLHDTENGLTIGTLTGGSGHDTYFLSQGSTILIEAANGGHDRVVSDVDGYVLPANIENLILGTAISGSGNELSNQIRGNASSNSLIGGGGDDWITGLGGSDGIDGGAGLDTAVYAEWSTDIRVVSTGTGFAVTSQASPDDTDRLSGVERIKLNDVMIGLDIDGVGGKAYRVYQAAFDRTPDLAGLGYWINAMDKGASLQQVSGGFVQSPEFIALYGAGADNLSLVTRMYSNVLDRKPDQAGLDYWVDLLDRKVITVADALAGFSESTENYAAVIGQIEHGFFFIAGA